MNTPLSSQSVEQPLRGAYCQLDELIGTRLAAAALQLRHRRRALSQLGGGHSSNFRGRGLDFAEVRAYQPGDDVRSIDWRVTARTGRAHTKLFHEERERPALVVVDQRQGMFFGSRHCCKSVLAGHLAASIAWAALREGDRVGGLVFGNEDQREVRPRRSHSTVLSLLHVLMDYNARLTLRSGLHGDDRARLRDMLAELRRISRPGSAIYLISDFAGIDDADVGRHLFDLSRHCELTAFFVCDPLEQALPPPGLYTVSDGERRQTIDTGGAALSRAFALAFAQRRERLHAELNRLGIPLLDLSTAEAPQHQLRRFYY